MITNFGRLLIFGSLIILACQTNAAEDPIKGLPDFVNDRVNTVKDYLTGNYLTPQLPGEVFEWPTVSRIDWDNDGQFDLLVGYNL
jgi:hypothetical protein